MFIGRKEFIDAIRSLQEQLNNQREINDGLSKQITELNDKLQNLTTILAMNALQKVMDSMAEGNKRKKTKTITKKGSKKKPCSK